jgi:hypothetical protein
VFDLWENAERIRNTKQVDRKLMQNHWLICLRKS